MRVDVAGFYLRKKSEQLRELNKRIERLVVGVIKALKKQSRRDNDLPTATTCLGSSHPVWQ